MRGHTPVALSVVRNITFIGTLSHENCTDQRGSTVVNDSTLRRPPYSIKSRWAHPVEKQNQIIQPFRKTALVTNSWLQTWKNGITKSTKSDSCSLNPPRLWHSGSGRRKWALLHDKTLHPNRDYVSFSINHPPARVYATAALTSAVL